MLVCVVFVLCIVCIGTFWYDVVSSLCIVLFVVLQFLFLNILCDVILCNVNCKCRFCADCIESSIRLG